MDPRLWQNAAMSALRPIRLPELLERHAGVLLDAYGVLVNLDGALPGAATLIRHLNLTGQPYLVVSNTAARLPESAAQRYRTFGLDLDPERILTSGLLLAQPPVREQVAGLRCLVLGPPDSREYVIRAGGLPVTWEEDFQVLVLADQAGFPFLEAMDQILSRLFTYRDTGREVPLLLPNPDLIYPTGAGYGITAGSVALVLEAALEQRYPGQPGNRFQRLGKPFPELFALAARRLGTRDLVMLGDQLETDIRGARDYGIAAALVSGGVSAGWPGPGENGITPDYLLAGLDGL